LNASALTGLRAWVVQRVSAIYLALFIIYCLVAALTADEFSYSTWRDWLSQPFANIAVGLFFLALLLHAWVGVRDILLDYVHHTGWRFALLSLFAVTLLAMGLWVARVLFAVAQI
jgi:succinate dehydrogenase / fumarate reductase membrane anchor subunit